MRKINIIIMIILISSNTFTKVKISKKVFYGKQIVYISQQKNNFFIMKNILKQFFNTGYFCSESDLSFTNGDKNGARAKTWSETNNTIMSKEKMSCKKLPFTKLTDIEKEPSKYKNKFVRLRGYAWNWFSKRKSDEIKRLSKLPLAKGNTAITRSDGNFSDGTALVFLPSPPKIPGKYILCAKILIKKGKWILKPICYNKVDWK